MTCSCARSLCKDSSKICRIYISVDNKCVIHIGVSEDRSWGHAVLFLFGVLRGSTIVEKLGMGSFPPVIMEHFHLWRISTLYIHTNPGIELWGRDVFKIDDCDVIQAHYAAVSKATLQNMIQQPQEGGWSALQTKRHDPKKGTTQKMWQSLSGAGFQGPFPPANNNCQNLGWWKQLSMPVTQGSQKWLAEDRNLPRDTLKTTDHKAALKDIPPWQIIIRKNML